MKFIAIHCSASKPSVYVDAKVIDQWHRHRGFLKIGYHFVIKTDGTIETGRRLDEAGAHVEGFNHKSIGICLAGGLNDAGKPAFTFSSVQMKSLIELLNKLTPQFPEAVVQGHRDFPNVRKDCPCFDVKPWWAEVRKP